MTRSEAIQTYIKGHVHSTEVLRRIMKWNPKLSIPENAKALGLEKKMIRNFVSQYKLKYRKCERTRNGWR